MVTSSEDGLVRLFDLRQSGGGSTAAGTPRPADGEGGAIPTTTRAAAQMLLPKKEEALSVSLGYDGSLAAVGGSRGHVHFYDLRGGIGGGSSGPGARMTSEINLIGTYVDAHTEEVTRVRSQPSPGGDGGPTTTTTLIVTSSEDGLAVVHDTSKPTEELALVSVLNVGSPLKDVWFFGPAMEGLYCVTGSATMSIWHHDSGQRICDFGDDVREKLSNSIAGDVNTDYLVGCQWDGTDLSLVAGNVQGDAVIFRLDSPGSISPSHLLVGGHKRGPCVRLPSCLPAGKAMCPIRCRNVS